MNNRFKQMEHTSPPVGKAFAEDPETNDFCEQGGRNNARGKRGLKSKTHTPHYFPSPYFYYNYKGRK